MGWRHRSAPPAAGSNAWRYEESEEAQTAFERRVQQGEDIQRLLQEQSGAAFGRLPASPTPSTSDGELDVCRLAATLSALAPAERLRLEPTLFTTVPAADLAQAEAAVGRGTRVERMGRGRGRGTGPGAAAGEPTAAPQRQPAAAEAGGRGRGLGRGRGRGEDAGFASSAAGSG